MGDSDLCLHAQVITQALASAGLVPQPRRAPPAKALDTEPPHEPDAGERARTAARPPAAAFVTLRPGRDLSPSPDPDPSSQRARWRLVVAAGLVAAPFLPAANVLFPVGTFIGERLLYAPSVGFCLLAADGLARLAAPHLPRLLLLWAPSDPGALCAVLQQVFRQRHMPDISNGAAQHEAWFC